MNEHILFDPHCEKQRNLKTVDVQTSALHTEHRCFIFPFGPGFKTTLEVRHNNKLLTEGLDYYTGHRYLKGTHVTCRELIGSIWSVDKKISGVLNIKVHVLGGEYIATPTQINRYLTNSYKSPSIDSWENILEGDVFFPPVSVKFDIDNWKGETALIDAITDLKHQHSSIDISDNPLYKTLADRIERLSQLFIEAKTAEHINNYNNPHEDTHESIGALHRLASAKNSLLAYGKNISELTKHIHDNGISLETLTPYLRRDIEQLVSGDIYLKNGFCTIRFNVDERAVIDLSSGNIKLISNGNIIINSTGSIIKNSDVELSLSASNVQNNNCLTYNGDVVITEQNLSEHHVGVTVTADVKFANSGTFDFSGKGTTSDPLTGQVKYPSPANGKKSLVRLTSDENINIFDVAATPKLIKKMINNSANLLKGSYSVNGYNITLNPNLNKEDIGLSETDNTADLNKPLSISASEKINTLSPLHHKHKGSDLVTANATISTYGIASTIDPQSPTISTMSDNIAIRADFGSITNTFFAKAKIDANRKVSGTMVSTKAFYFVGADELSTNEVFEIDSVGNSINLLLDGKFYYFGNWYSSEPTTINLDVPYGLPNKYFGLYATAGDDNKISWEVKNYTLLETDNSLLVFKLTKVKDMIHLSNYYGRILRIGKFKELVDHEKEIYAHGLDLSKWSMANTGLSALENDPTVYHPSNLVSGNNTNHDSYIAASVLREAYGFANTRVRSGKITNNSLLPVTINDFPYPSGSGVDPNNKWFSLHLSHISLPQAVYDAGGYVIVTHVDESTKKPFFKIHKANVNNIGPEFDNLTVEFNYVIFWTD